MTEIPRRAYVKNLGQVRILSYKGNGYFFVLTKRDERYLKHRNQMEMLKK